MDTSGADQALFCMQPMLDDAFRMGMGKLWVPFVAFCSYEPVMTILEK